MESSRQEYWSGLPFPSPGDLPNPGIKPRSPILQADSLPFEPPGKPKNTGVGSLPLLQGIFLTQELNWDPPALQADALPPEPPGKPQSHDINVGYSDSSYLMVQYKLHHDDLLACHFSH